MTEVVLNHRRIEAGDPKSQQNLHHHFLLIIITWLFDFFNYVNSMEKMSELVTIELITNRNNSTRVVSFKFKPEHF